ncbi:hypothetical protein DXT76_16165 [Halobacillus trueperi]|uniref:Uncharacterized protein n=1 Tax=Halobacillus trueperi TaxID=156205 RepID=A0A3D8VKI9_9BACI|nr:hypothetical protein [Halobacillus trueperi]RDY69862.1 hypothetical protein DXT76_16165 [Halobacillus trueperi]
MSIKAIIPFLDDLSDQKLETASLKQRMDKLAGVYEKERIKSEKRINVQLRKAKLHYLKALYDFYQEKNEFDSTFETLKSFHHRFYNKSLSIEKFNLAEIGAFKGTERSLRIFDNEILNAMYHGHISENVHLYIDYGITSQSNEKAMEIRKRLSK